MRSRREFVVGGAVAVLAALCRNTQAQTLPAPAVVTVKGGKPANWETASPQSQRMSEPAVSSALDAGEKIPGLRSLLAVRNGVLIAERYYGGATASDLLAINSSTKSVSSLLVGLALKRKTIASLTTPVSRLLPDDIARVPNSPAAEITLEQILSGRSGLTFSWMQYRDLITAPDPVGYALSRPRGVPSVSGWTYNDAVVSLLSHILSRAEGLELSALATRDLFVPLGIERFAWVRDQKGNAIANAGLALRTRDLAKIAWVMLDGGKWRGVEVIPSPWIDESTQTRGPADWSVPPMTNIGYGYLWFTGTLHGQRVAWAWGYGGQFALIAPALKLAVATAAISPVPEALYAQTNAVMALAGQLVRAAS